MEIVPKHTSQNRKRRSDTINYQTNFFKNYYFISQKLRMHDEQIIVLCSAETGVQYKRCKRDRGVVGSSGPPLPTGDTCRTPRGCLKPRTVPNAVCTMFFLYRQRQ